MFEGLRSSGSFSLYRCDLGETGSRHSSAWASSPTPSSAGFVGRRETLSEALGAQAAASHQFGRGGGGTPALSQKVT